MKKRNRTANLQHVLWASRAARLGKHVRRPGLQSLNLVLGLAVSWAVGCATAASGQAQLDEELAAGLVATYHSDAGPRFERVDDRIAFFWRGGRPQARHPDDLFRVVWRGYLMSQSPGEYRLFARFSGELQVKLAGQLVLSAEAVEPDWVASQPLQLPFDYHDFEVRYRSSSGQSQLTLFWSGPQFQLEPIGAKYFYHDPASTPLATFERGADLARALRCAACHVAAGQLDPIPGPSLEHLAGNVERAWLVSWLTEGPESGSATTRRMPHFGLAGEEATAIADYLLSQSRPTELQPASDPGRGQGRGEQRAVDPVSEGRELFLSVGCLACHQLGPHGTKGLFDGGDLTRIAAKRPQPFFERWLAAPDRINQHHRMPVFELSPRERTWLGAFLAAQGTAAASSDEADPLDPRSVALGKRLVVRHRCHACHELADASVARAAPSLPLLASREQQGGCLGVEAATANQPVYQLSTEDRRALRHFVAQNGGLGQKTAASNQGARIIRERKCLACHARDGAPGLAAQLETLASAMEDLAPELPALTPPSLDSVGDKLHRRALIAAIQRSGPPLRDYLRVRMPRFALTAAEIDAVADTLIHADRIPAARTEPPDDDQGIDGIALRAVGSRLVTADGFGCTSCHQVGGVTPSKAPLNARGPTLSQLGQRVRRAWFDRLLHNPPRVVAKMEMPSVRLAVRGVLGDDLDRQLSAVWGVLNQPGFEPPEPNPVRVLRRSGVAEQRQRAVVVTDVVRVRDHSFLKPLLIGLPNRHNVLFDLQSASLSRWTVGDTARQRTEGKTWFWEAAGNELLDTRLEAPELAYRQDGRPWMVDQPGQFPTEFDTLYHLPSGLGFQHRLHFRQPDSDTVRTLHVRQEFTVLAGRSGHSGVRRLIEVSGAAEGSLVQLQIVGPGSPATHSADRPVLMLAGAPASIEVTEPAGAVIDPSGAIAVRSSSATEPARFEVVYRTELTIDRFPVPVPQVTSIEPARLEVVPGFESIRLPLTPELMPTALSWNPGGELFIASLKGRVWRARDSDGDEFEDQLTPFSDELAAPYGIAAHRDHVDVINKYGLLRLVDQDRDGQVDRTVTIASGWGHTADYHDWAVGLPQDSEGNYYAAFPCQQDDRSAAAARWRGSVVKLAPRTATADDPRIFAIEPISAGHRFPMGMARSAAGDLFVTDNQGNYNPFNELNHVQAGARYGFINKLERRPGFDPALTPPAINIPHPWTRSVNGICFLNTPQASRQPGRHRNFGPFEGHLVGCEYDTRRLVRMTLEQVGGSYQGAVYPFSYEAPPDGPPFIGPLACAVAPDGDLYIGGIRDSGWGGANNIGEVVRLRISPAGLPCGIAEVRAHAQGLTIEFTRPVDRGLAARPDSYSVSSYTRDSTPAYGGNDRDRRNDAVLAVAVSSDARQVVLTVPELRAGYVYEIHLKNLTGQGRPFFPADAYYTMRSTIVD